MDMLFLLILTVQSKMKNVNLAADNKTEQLADRMPAAAKRSVADATSATILVKTLVDNEANRM